MKGRGTGSADFFRRLQTVIAGHSEREGKGSYEAWRQRPGYTEIAKFAEGSTHRRIFDLSTEDIREVMRWSGHALGDVRKEEALHSIEDFTCPVALQHIFHGYPEERDAVPTWEEFHAFMHREARKSTAPGNSRKYQA
jgi:hypothetical protein